MKTQNVTFKIWWWLLLILFCGCYGNNVFKRQKSRSHHHRIGAKNGTKKAIVPKRRTSQLRLEMEKELEQHYHNDYHRPNFPEKEISPHISMKPPDVPDLSLLPAKPTELPFLGHQPPVKVQQVVVVPPPAPPPPPLVIQTGSGPAATVSQPIPLPPKPPKELLDLLGNPTGGQQSSGDTQAAAGGAGAPGLGGGGTPPGVDGGGATPGGGAYDGSGPARGGEEGLAGPYLGSGSGDGDLTGGMNTHGADWTGAGVPSPGAKYPNSNGKLPLNQLGGDISGLMNAGGGNSNGASAAAAAGVASVLMNFCCKSHKDGRKNVTALCQLYKQFHKNLKCMENIMQANADLATAGMAEITHGHSRPIQIARGFLGAELFRLEDIIGNLNKKIDIIGDRVTKRPNQLARASLMAGMTSTFGDLQNTIELLNQKLDRRMNPSQGEYLASLPEEEREKTKAINILSKQLEQLGGAGWLGSKGFGLSLHRHEEEMREAQIKGREEAQVSSNKRLEELMHLVADRLSGLSEQMDHPPTYESHGPGADPILRQEEENLMGKQLQIQHQMGVIQAGLQGLANLVVHLQNARASAVPQSGAIVIPQKFIELIQKVLGSAASAFHGIALTTKGAGNHIVNSMNQHVAHAGSLGDHLLAAGHTIDAKLESLKNGGNLHEIMDSLAATYGNVASGGFPYGGKLYGIHGGNEGIRTASIPQLAASIALIPAPGEASLNRRPLVEDVPSTDGIAHFLDTNTFSYGYYGNRGGRPHMGLVTGNLGGSLGLGGIDGIDGGNTLILNKTIKTKRQKLIKPFFLKPTRNVITALAKIIGKSNSLTMQKSMGNILVKQFLVKSSRKIESPPANTKVGLNSKTTQESEDNKYNKSFFVKQGLTSRTYQRSIDKKRRKLQNKKLKNSSIETSDETEVGDLNQHKKIDNNDNYMLNSKANMKMDKTRRTKR